MSEEETIEKEEPKKKAPAKKAPAKKTPAKKTPAKKETQKIPEKQQSQIIYIGKKDTISYVLVAVTILNKSDMCSIQARGRQISKAVDIAEITRRKFLQDMIEVDEVIIGSEEIHSDEEGIPPKTVSTVEIILKRK
ncbi:MAG: hypothetical protein ACTSSN_11335 [Candidatus Heimdallarchaeaceae archaeon]